MTKSIILSMLALCMMFLASCKTVEIDECQCPKTIKQWPNPPIPQPPASN